MLFLKSVQTFLTRVISKLSDSNDWIKKKFLVFWPLLNKRVKNYSLIRKFMSAKKLPALWFRDLENSINSNSSAFKTIITYQKSSPNLISFNSGSNWLKVNRCSIFRKQRFHCVLNYFVFHPSCRLFKVEFGYPWWIINNSKNCFQKRYTNNIYSCTWSMQHNKRELCIKPSNFETLKLCV